MIIKMIIQPEGIAKLSFATPSTKNCMIMNNRLSPISAYNIQVYAYNESETSENDFAQNLCYDDRRDFLTDESFRGIAIKLGLRNQGFFKGVRRMVSVSIVDLSARVPLATQEIKVNISQTEYARDIFTYFPMDTDKGALFRTYRIMVCDETARRMICETVFHLFDGRSLRHPAQWYKASTGGLRLSWMSDLYKTLDTDDDCTYYVKFTLSQHITSVPPAILPELELRLYRPEGQVDIQFKELGYIDQGNGCDKDLCVEFPFSTSEGNNGVHYAELLCMEYAIAGFAFDTRHPSVPGSWPDYLLVPMDEVNLDEARERLEVFLHPEKSKISPTVREEDNLDSLIDDFINSERYKIKDDNSYSADSDKELGKLPEKKSEEENDDEQSFSSSLDNLTGLKAVKEKLTIYERVARFNRLRADNGLPVAPAPLHAMFLGSPGTGKTTVAKIMGKMLHSLGVLSKGHVVVRERATLLGQFYNSEAEKTIAALEEARGGILFIDEAYQLYQPEDPRDPGKFVIETLLTALADDSQRDWMLIMAGYTDEMLRLFKMNPGFRSRIPDCNIYQFDDFSETELMQIAENYLTRSNYVLTPEAHAALSDRLKSDFDRRDRSFGNARHVMNMIQTEILPAMAVRVMDRGLCDEISLTEILPADIPAPVVKKESVRMRVGFAI